MTTEPKLDYIRPPPQFCTGDSCEMREFIQIAKEKEKRDKIKNLS